MWTLGERGRVYSIKVDVSEFQEKLKVHIRHYRKSVEEGEEQWYPTKRGIALDLEEWDTLSEQFIAIDTEVRRLRSRNEDVKPIFGGGIKRDLQSAFGANYI